jgi:hypothetical protein
MTSFLVKIGGALLSLSPHFIPVLLPLLLSTPIRFNLTSFLSRTPEEIMTYSIENHAPDAVVITILDDNSNTIHISISRAIGGATIISVVQNGGATIESGILGGDFKVENLY